MNASKNGNQRTIAWNQAELVWDGDGLPTKLLLTFCRLLPHFRGKGRLFQWLAAHCFHGELLLHNGLGARLKIDPADYIGRTIAFDGNFEPKSVALALEIMKDGGVFLDVGCNFGLYTLCVGMLPGVECIAIDGSFVALSKFAANLNRNRGINARLVECALGAESGLVCFELADAQNLGSTRIADNADKAQRRGFWAAAVTLQSVLERLAPEQVKLLKIDVEGSEMVVFNGLDLDGYYRPQNLIVECYAEIFPQAKKVFEFLISKGYEAMTVDGRSVADCTDLPEQNVWFRSVRNPSSEQQPLSAGIGRAAHAGYGVDLPCR
jgi:FkbM family methyltransferase